MCEPIDLDAIRRNYLPEMLGARDDRRLNCECQRGGVDAVSVDGDWLHAAGEQFAAAVDEVERLRAENADLRASDLAMPICCPTPGCMFVYFSGDVCPGCGNPEAADAEEQGLYAEPANAHQRGGERLPSDDTAAPTQVDADADVSPVGSAFPPPLLDEWCRRHEDNGARPIGPVFAMPETQEGQS